MRTFTTLLFLLINALPVLAQSSPYAWQWATSLAATNTLWGRGLARDAAGNVYVTGWYSGTGTIGSIALPSVTGTLHSGYFNHGLYLAKFNAVGVVQWVQELDGPGQDGGMRVATDQGGNVYITGRLTGAQTIGSSRLPAVGTAEAPYTFLAKFDTNGVAQWAVQGASTSQLEESWDHTTGLAVDMTGNVYAAIDGITKYSAAGTTTWHTPTSSATATSLTIGSQGQVVAGGFFQGTAVLGTGSGAITITSVPPSPDGFTAQLSSLGRVQWVQTATGTGSDILAKEVMADATDNVYVMGTTNGGLGSVQFGPVTVPSVATYLTKYTPTGTLLWANNVPVNGLYAMSATTDASGTTYVGGAGSLAAFTSGGTRQWTMSDNLERLFGLVVHGNELCVTGNYRSQGGTAGTIPLPATGATQHISGFVGKLTGVTLATTAPTLPANWTVYPNPAQVGRVQLALLTSLAGSVELSLTNTSGQKIKTAVVPSMVGPWHYAWDLPGVPSGVYLIRLCTTRNSQTYRLVLE